MTTSIKNKGNALLAALVATTIALAAYVGYRGIMSERAGGVADEAARKEAFEKAMKKGNLSFVEAEHWRLAPGTAETAGPAAP